MATLLSRIEALLAICDRLIREMDFTPFQDKSRALLTIGYEVATQQMTKSCYDLLASEARAATFVAVAKGEVPQDVWFRLGRQHTICEGENVLISWTGTMFEYLMPVIWMKSYPNTLLDRAVRSAVRAQQSYGMRQRVPWGISESAHSTQDPEGVYQYAAFGVPGLALSVIPEKKLVISPYSTCLALLVDPPSAVENLMLMARKGWLSDYGFYESADYTDSARGHVLPRKCKVVPVWMAHHQGMSLTSICNVLHESAFQRWFHAEPVVQASDLILQERTLRVRPIRDLHPRRVLKFARSFAKRPMKPRAASA